MDEVSSIESEEPQYDFSTICTTKMGTTSVKYCSDPCTILGNGVKAIVYPGYHFGINKPVAVKFIKRRYLRVENGQVNELQIWSKIHESINIIRLYDSYRDPRNGLFLAMEKAERTFRRQITKCNPMKTETINWLYQVAQAVKYLHGEGIIHRDIKPDNILMILQDGKLVAKLADFGVSKMISNLEKTGTYSHAKGTLLWMAPEALENQNQRFKNTRKLDIYALGMTIYFGLSKGDHPFLNSPNEDFMTTVGPRMTDQFATPNRLSLSEVAANDLLSRMMERQPNNRPDITEVLSHCLFWGREKEHLFLVRSAICLSKTGCMEIDEVKKEIDATYLKYFSEIYPFKVFNWISTGNEKFLNILELMFAIKKRKSPRSTEYGEGNSVTKFLKFFRDKYVHYPEIKPEGLLKFSENDGIFCENVYVKTLTAICPGLISVLYKTLLRHSNKESLLPLTKVYFPWKINKPSKPVSRIDAKFQNLSLSDSLLHHCLHYSQHSLSPWLSFLPQQPTLNQSPYPYTPPTEGSFSYPYLFLHNQYSPRTSPPVQGHFQNRILPP